MFVKKLSPSTELFIYPDIFKWNLWANDWLKEPTDYFQMKQTELFANVSTPLCTWASFRLELEFMNTPEL